MLKNLDLIDFEVKNSSNLTHISWKRDIGPTTKGTLKVSFHNGLKYEYYGVPKSLVDQLYEIEKLMVQLAMHFIILLLVTNQ